jgi:hypothetical protein
VIEGPMGIDHLLGMKIDIDWDKQGYEGVTESTIKKYNSMIHTYSWDLLLKPNVLNPGQPEADITVTPEQVGLYVGP